MQSLRILHVTPYYREAWGYGGIPRVATALCTSLAGRGHRVTVCTTDARDAASRATDPGGLARLRPRPPLEDHDVEVLVFPNLSNNLAYRLQVFVPLGLRAYLRRNVHRFHVAHLHGCHHVPGSLAAAELRRADVPYVIAPNGTAPRIERRLLAKWLFNVTLGRGVVGGAGRAIAVTRAEQGQLERLGLPRARIRVIPNPVDADVLTSAVPRGEFRRRCRVPFARFVLYLGQISPRKGVDLLAQAFARLSAPDLGLVVAGNDAGHGRKVEREVRKLGLHDRVLITGQLEGTRRLEALADAEVVAYPGQHEVFGLVPLEALLVGTPVVVAGDSGCGEVIREVGGGLVVPHGDLVALAQALRTVLARQSHWRQAAQDAAHEVRARFSPAGVATAVERVYRELVPGAGA